MLLKGKNVVIYGAGGAIGSAAALAFAREGAKVFLTGNTMAKIETAAREISATGGISETAQVDALDEQAVEQQHAGEVAKTAGGIDVSFNLIAVPNIQGTAIVDMRVEDFAVPVMNYVAPSCRSDEVHGRTTSAPDIKPGAAWGRDRFPECCDCCHTGLVSSILQIGAPWYSGPSIFTPPMKSLVTEW